MARQNAPGKTLDAVVRAPACSIPVSFSRKHNNNRPILFPAHRKPTPPRGSPEFSPQHQAPRPAPPLCRGPRKQIRRLPLFVPAKISTISEPYPMMLLLYEGDVRRCRRCKRRRMDDEPPEVQQYKTCAKCRIIERTKKKSRKPLAEETMRYGMRQFQEQLQNLNFIHDDIFLNDQLMNDMHAAAAAHDALVLAPGAGYKPPGPLFSPLLYAMYKQPPAPQYGAAQAPPQAAPNAPAPPPGALGVPGAVPTSSAAAAAIAAAAIKRTDVLLGTSQTLNRMQNHYRQYQQKQQGGDRSRLSAATNCELCAQALDADDSMSVMYRLCRSCYSDPYARPNVYSDFNDFLLAVVRDKDVELVTYISELASYLVESLSNNRAINSEEQFRKIMLDSFSLIYVDPLIGLLTPLAFNRSSHNVHDVNNTAPIISKVSQQYHYTLTPPLRINYIADSDAGSTSIDMTFITETNLIIMKKTTKKASQLYEPLFLKALDEKMRANGFTFDDDPAKLYELLSLPILKDQLVKDFKSLQKQVADIRASGSEGSPDDVAQAEHAFELSEKGAAEPGQKTDDSLEPEAAEPSANGADEAAAPESEVAPEKLEESAPAGETAPQEKKTEEELKESQEPGDLDPAFAS
ncbi:hypothetical protein METBIDRAFT_32742 [Metschnikowia bicuspidata var. bicuspidata NRRL YB-4993]|uniref:Uncharacterized protein n=1 Tax=Metschnikowia bicuspidata var. bicuspidata NRRL YB-4993 TaxID=869754 RepID=A0A1A0H9V0_9ASCO|nr:hypothetical protein METBIDRAFT_32742 [Metschnikowia bicuspidata var. bicuspidata NRRL YB-4993]OBA20791.1 hypothetical protein METBIDRAFT_32742 [Metschnikowia bicuspidata var. bicuspidata NRRL YB-4993]